MKFIDSANDVRKNIETFNGETDKLRHLLSTFRAWYAAPGQDGLTLGPSKFIGYKDITAELYLKHCYSQDRHGRVMPGQEHERPLNGGDTESRLKKLSERLDEKSETYALLRHKLEDLCGEYGKKPNKLARISVLKS